MTFRKLRAVAAGCAAAWMGLTTGCSHAPSALQATAAPAEAKPVVLRRGDAAPAWRPSPDLRWPGGGGAVLQPVFAGPQDTGRATDLVLPRGAHLAAHLAEARADRRAERLSVFALTTPPVEPERVGDPPVAQDVPRTSAAAPMSAAEFAAPFIAAAQASAAVIGQAQRSATALTGPWRAWGGGAVLALLLAPLLIWAVGRACRVAPAAATRPASPPRTVPPPSSHPVTMSQIEKARPLPIPLPRIELPPMRRDAALPTALPWREADSGHTAAQVLLVTAPSYATDKAAVAAELAELWAENGRRVVLVEADLQSPQAQRQLGIMGRPAGLTDMLEGAGEGPEVLLTEGRAGVDVVTCGTRAEVPERRLFDPQLARIIDALRQRYDKVVLHVPPVMATGDALAFAGCVDAAWLVVPAGQRDSDEASESVRRLESGGIRVGQVVIHAPAPLPAPAVRGPDPASTPT